MTQAIRVHTYGGPEVLKWEAVEVGAPSQGQVRVRQTAIGVNYIDVYSRTGFYPQASLPFIPGMEAAGVVTAVAKASMISKSAGVSPTLDRSAPMPRSA
jgi:NADPH2:quinone reductase